MEQQGNNFFKKAEKKEEKKEEKEEKEEKVEGAPAPINETPEERRRTQKKEYKER